MPWRCDYSGRFGDELAAKPLDRAMLAGFAELVRAVGAGPVADIGCGTGRVTAHLTGLGLSAFGIDLSPQMIAVARRSHPDLRFDVGSMLALDLPDGALGGVPAWPGWSSGPGSCASPTRTATSRKTPSRPFSWPVSRPGADTAAELAPGVHPHFPCVHHAVLRHTVMDGGPSGSHDEQPWAVAGRV